MIQIQQLEKSFGTTKVLQGIDITIEDGQIFGLVGVSGAGKSTLLRCINGLERYDAGHLLVDGIEVGNLSERELRAFRRNVGMIFQHFSLLERKTVRDNVTLPMLCHGFSRAEANARATELLQLVGLSDKEGSLPRELSGGQKQRVAIARALTMNPRILLCDEATSALDPNTTRSVLDLLKQINHDLGITVVIVTHAMSVVKAACDAAAILDKGVLVYKGDVEELFLHHADALESVTGPVPRPELAPGEVAYAISQRNGSETILSRMALGSGVAFRVVAGELDRYRDDVAGTYTITVDAGQVEAFEAFLAANPDADWQRIAAREA